MKKFFSLRKPNVSTTRFLRDEKGTTLIEFCLVLPFLLFTFLGFSSIVHMETASTRVGQVSSAVADITAQSPVTDQNLINQAMDAAESIMGGIGTNNLEMVVMGIEIEPDAGGQPVAKVRWAHGRNNDKLAVPAVGSIYDLPTASLSNGNFLVSAEVQLNYRPIFGGNFFLEWGDDDMTLKYENHYAPRNSLEVDCTDC